MNDRAFYLVLGSLAACAALCIAGIVVSTSMGKEPPAVLGNTLSGIVSGVFAMLIKPPVQHASVDVPLPAKQG